VKKLFTGIIEGLGIIANIKQIGQAKRLKIEAIDANFDFDFENTKIGESIAVNGVCLTAIEIYKSAFEADVSPETISKSTFSKIKQGERINIERALKLSDRLNGHLVLGHVDGIGLIKNKQKYHNAIIITIEVSQDLSKYIIKKGSIAIDGISLTINDCDNSVFQVSIIPHTAKLTTIGFKQIGDFVNIETDIIGKYIEKFIIAKQDFKENIKHNNAININFLAQNGFL